MADDTISTENLEISVGLDDTIRGVKLGIDGEAFWRVHITPQGEVLVGDGTAPPEALSTGGGSGDVATDSIWDAVGDLVVGSGVNTAVRLPKGAEATFLRAGAATLAWATIAIGDVSGLQSALDGKVGSSEVTGLETLTEAEHAALDPAVATTLYIITDSPESGFVGLYLGDTLLLSLTPLVDGVASAIQSGDATVEFVNTLTQAQYDVLDPVDVETLYLTRDSQRVYLGADLLVEGVAAHVDDTTDAHLASAIGSTPTGDLTGTDVQANLTELDARLTGLLEFSPDFLQGYTLMYDDFPGQNITSGQIGTHGWEWGQANTGAIAATAGIDLSEPGLRQLSVTTTSPVDASHIGLGGTSFYVIGAPLSVLEWRVMFNNVPGSSQDYTGRVGLMTTAIFDSSDGAWFETTYNGGDIAWRAKSRNNSGTIETTDTNIVPANNTWQRLRITCDGAGTYRFYIDGTLVATHTTVASAVGLAPRAGIIKQVGANIRHMRVGYCYLLAAIPR